MSTTDDSTDAQVGPLRLSPDFELTFAYDDPDSRSLVTVYPTDGDDITTQWISIDAEHAVPFVEAR